MNILYLHTHDMGRYNQIYGYPMGTPNFWAIAKDSTVFRNAHCAGPTCSPSRAALLTGMYPHSAGILGLAHRGFEIAAPRQHLSWFLKNQGYRTALFGVQHEVADAAKLGYDDFFDVPWNDRCHDRRITDQARAYIGQYQGDAPLFISVGLFDPHRPYRDSNPGAADFVTPPAILPDAPQTRKDYADYIASVVHADTCAGTVLDALKEKGLYDDMLIILTTDHGIAFPFMKCNLYDSGTGVTLAVKLPRQRRHRVVDQLISQIDVFPTVCDLIGAAKPQWLQGRSFLDILNGSRAEINRSIFAEVTYHAAYEPQRSVRTLRYKYIRRYGGFRECVLPNIDAGDSKTFFLQEGIRGREMAAEELFDLIYDPAERNNLADDPKYAAIKGQLTQELAEWQRGTADPILDPNRPFEADWRVNPADQTDPDEIHFLKGRSDESDQ